MKTVIIVPAFNEGKIIAAVVQKIKVSCPATDIIVIDDGSSDNTYTQALTAGAIALRHTINRGQGAALRSSGLGINVIPARLPPAPHPWDGSAVQGVPQGGDILHP